MKRDVPSKAAFGERYVPSGAPLDKSVYSKPRYNGALFLAGTEGLLIAYV